MAGVTMLTKTKMRIVEIEDIVEETRNTKTFSFTDADSSEAEPGQFVMVWVPSPRSGDVDFSVPDQIPMSISSVKEERVSITVRRCGETTEELFNYERGNLIGITGPLGRGFTLEGESVLCVGGGIGAAPLRFLAQKMKKKVHFVLGAKSKEELLFLEELRSLCASLVITTDDGSYGVKGVASDVVEERCKDVDHLFCCGPEKMMYKILEISLRHGIPAQFSLERYMYCGIGLCGHCTVDGFLVCRDGPVFTSEELKKVKDFGMKKIDETGKKVDI